MRVVVFSSCPSYPTHAGNSARVASVGERLKKLGHEVHFLYFDHQAPMTPEQREGMIHQWDSFHYIPFQPGSRPDRKGQPWQADDWFQTDIGLHVQSVCTAMRPDVVICNYAFHSKLFEFVNRDAIKVLDTHDVFTDRHLMLDAAGLPRRFYFTDRSTEALQLRRADVILSIQHRETELLRTLVAKPVVTVGHMTNEAVVPRPANAVPKVGFIASGNHLNRQALKAFLDGAADNLAEGLYELVIAGAVCDDLPEMPGLSSLGRVEDLDDFYGAVDLAINPMAHGTGLKIKTIEALQYGVPLVSTACGFDGLSSSESEHCLADAAAVAARVAEVVGDPTSLKRLAEASRQIFETYADAQTRTFDTLFQSRTTLEEFVGEPSALETARNQATRTVLIATHARFWRSGLGSHVRIRQLVDELSRHYRVVVFMTLRLSAEDRSAIAMMGLPIEVVGIQSEPAIFGEDNEDVLLGRIDHQVISESFRQIVEAYPPSVCIVEYLRLSFLIKLLPSYTVRIIDTHDLISRRQESRSRFQQTVPVRRRAEIRALTDFDFILTIQRTEMAVVDCWIGGHNALYLPLFFEDHCPLVSSSEEPAAIGFIGGNSDANFSAICWFLEHVWPYFSRSETRFRVAGSIVDRLSEPIEGVDLVGPTDLDEFYGSIQLAVNPVQWGGGMKIKTIEALSYGLPVVSTSEGATGLEEAHGRGLAIADSGPGFALLLSKLITDPHLRRTQGEAGRSFVVSEFGREPVFRDLHAVIQSASPNWPIRAARRHG